MSDGSEIVGRIRRCFSQSLILCFFLAGCFSNARTSEGISVQWNDSIATGLIVPRHLLPAPSDSIRRDLFIHLVHDAARTPVFGEYFLLEDVVIFQPLIPLTRNLSYEVVWKDKSLGMIDIPRASDARVPTVWSVYPSADTVPENLLKLYVHFSQPMKETNPLSYVRLLTNRTDTLRNVFLDLRPALWNREGTVLTLWLDPGRIKRDLQPNQRLGSPLSAGGSYRLVIDDRWPSKEGTPLKNSYDKIFFVMARDNVSPDPRLWKIRAPSAGSLEPLIMEFGETLDALLLEEAIRVAGEDGKNINGTFRTAKEETVLYFVPAEEWQSGHYAVFCETRLEDLAGNNLNRLFDRDITVQFERKQEEAYRMQFTIEN